MKANAAKLVLYARQWCISPDDAVQEAFIDLAQLRESPTDPVAWLYKTTRYKALNQHRAENRRSQYHRQSSQTREAWFTFAPDLELQLQDLQAALESLPPQTREIIVARIWGELSFTQISTLVDLSTSSVFRAYRQGLEQLQKVLEGSENNVEQIRKRV